MKIQTTVTEKKQIEVELENPTYTKNGRDFNKIFEDERGIMCLTAYASDPDYYQVVLKKLSYVPEAADGEKITKEEFDAKFKNVQDMIDVALKYEPAPTDNSVDIHSEEVA